METEISNRIDKLLFESLCKHHKAPILKPDANPVEIIRDGLRELGHSDLLWMLEKSWSGYKRGDFFEAFNCAEISLDFIWEKLNTGYWKDVEIIWREAYTIGSLLKVLSSVRRGEDRGVVFKSCDMGLLMGTPILGNILSKVADIMQEESKRKHELVELEGSESNEKRRKIVDGRQRFDSDNTKNSSHISEICLNEEKSIPRVTEPSLHTFQTKHMTSSIPVIIINAMTHWPAMGERRWDIEYIKTKTGCRTVPVEIGDRYTSNDWTQKLLSVNEFIKRFIEKEDSNGKGYLAQHQLFDQIPELKSDICIPDYCCLGGSDDNDDVIINAWFGPRGTISPLHQDPYENLFAQVVGEKYIRLYDKKYSHMVYPHDSHLLDNTSQVDVENPDLEQFPLFDDAPYMECILKEGEMLYIPKKCWHYVRSLSLSFSVSFWWS